jgi:hypothetical protein
VIAKYRFSTVSSHWFIPQPLLSPGNYEGKIDVADQPVPIEIPQQKSSEPA